MEPVRRAVIDIGTNSVKLLVADVRGRAVCPVFEGSKQTRLGRGFYPRHRLSAEAITATADAVGAYALLAKEKQVANLRMIATSAARDASNAGELARALELASGLPLEIISGDQEAEWAFQGVSSDARYAEVPLLLLEVGGGSTQFILGQRQQIHFRESFRLGTVRLMEKIPHSDPPEPGELDACRSWLAQFLVQEIQPKLAPAMHRETTAGSQPALLVGTGGTATILARMETGMEDYERERIEATRISRERLRQQAASLWSMPLDRRKQVPGLPKNRADVILTGILIFEAVLENFGFSELRISTRGVRFGALMGA